MCIHNKVSVVRRGPGGSLFKCVDCGMITEVPGQTEWRSINGENVSDISPWSKVGPEKAPGQASEKP